VRPSNPESLPNIRRIDTRPKANRQTHGWQVHVVRQHDEHTKHFSDNTYGGKYVARTAAIHYRGVLLDQLPPSFTELGIQTSAHSNTGHVGITHTHQLSGKAEKPIPCFSVSVRTAKGVVRNTHIFYEPGKYEQGLKKSLRWRNKDLDERAEKIERRRKN
jgi:hypothetical protein